MKSKKELKEISEDALMKLLSTVNRNLSDEDSSSLCIELSASCFAYALDFNMPEKELVEKTIKELEVFKIMVLDGVINAKRNLPEGAHYYDNTKI